MLKQIITALSDNQSYPHPVDKVEVIQTATSVVFLTGQQVYKIGKPVNFGFLDLSTLDKRKQNCHNEVRLNSLVSPEMYLGVVPVINHNGFIRLSGGENTTGEIVEYATKMKQLSQDNILTTLLNQNKVSPQQIKRLAQQIFKFHSEAQKSAEISKFGELETVAGNWEEHFEQTKAAVPVMLNREDFEFMEQKVRSFIQENKNLITNRIIKNNIRHGHGDLHSGNIFLEGKKITLFDRIVFNQRFPCSDVISDLAFLAMDLDSLGKENFSHLLVEEYQKLSQDEDIDKLLNFYKCYRAYIRAKINWFFFNEATISEAEKLSCKETSQKYFNLALSYAQLF
ncbi:MAG TPA: gluconokinase [Candidatus Nanoarchaeia archaeon]|nr:gluconokinase [Candidatus Nanoarchaeia archaeon]